MARQATSLPVLPRNSESGLHQRDTCVFIVLDRATVLLLALPQPVPHRGPNWSRWQIWLMFLGAGAGLHAGKATTLSA